MTQENLGPVTEPQVPQSKQKKSKAKKILLWIFSLAIILAIAVSGGLFAWYKMGVLSTNTNGNPTHYRSSEVEDDIKEEIKDLDDNEFNYGSDVSSSDIFKDVAVKMDVTDNQAKVTVSYKFDRDAMSDLYDQLIEEELSGYSDDIKQEAMKSIPSNSEFMTQIDDQIAKSARQEGLDYDSQTGVISGELFEGEVHPLTRTIKISSYNKAFAEEENDDESVNRLGISTGDTISYKKDGDKVLLVSNDDEDDTITFSLD